METSGLGEKWPITGRWFGDVTPFEVMLIQQGFSVMLPDGKQTVEMGQRTDIP
jgi:hypothetical protein